MKFCQWYETKYEELTGYSPIYIYIFGVNSKSPDKYNYLEISKSFNRSYVLVEHENFGYSIKSMDIDLRNEVVVPYNENIFEKIDNELKRDLILGTFL